VARLSRERRLDGGRPRGDGLARGADPSRFGRIGIAARSFGSLFGRSRPNGRATARSPSRPRAWSRLPHDIRGGVADLQKRFMYMSGFTDEDRFENQHDAHLGRAAEKIRVPYLCIAARRQLSPLEHAEPCIPASAEAARVYQARATRRKRSVDQPRRRFVLPQTG